MGHPGTYLVVAALAAAHGLEPLRERAAVAQIVTAGDPFGKDVDRLEAVHALRRLEHPAGYDFMAAHVRLSFFPRASFEPPPLRECAPCYYCLTHDGRDRPRREDRAVAAAVLGALDAPRGDPEIGAYARILISVLTDRAGASGYLPARELVRAELGRHPQGDRKRNLERLFDELGRN